MITFHKWLFPWCARKEIKRLTRERNAALNWIKVTHKTDGINPASAPMDLIAPKENFKEKLLARFR